MGGNRPAAQITAQVTMIHTGTIWLSIFGVHALAAVFFTYLQRAKRQPYLQPWLAGWYLLVLHDLALGMVQWAQASTGPMMLVRVLTAASGVCFFAAARDVHELAGVETGGVAHGGVAGSIRRFSGVCTPLDGVADWIGGRVPCGRVCFLAGGPPAGEPGRLDAGCERSQAGRSFRW